MACKCIEKCNDEMERLALNTAVSVPLIINFGTGKCAPPMAMIATYKVDDRQRGKPKSIIATFCPFCGKRYEPAPKKRKDAP